MFLWDFEGDGTVDIKRKGEPIIKYMFSKSGKYNTTLKVVDPMKRSAEVKHEILVRGRCPDNMVFVPREAGRSFCIDKYEWPNKKGKVPSVNVSWIRAKMYCYDEGKRLCTAEEWQYACSGRKQKVIKGGGTLGRYPYGSQYKAELCPTEGHDLCIAIELVKMLNVPFGIINNRSDIGDDRINRLVEENGYDLLLEIPHDNEILHLYSHGLPLVGSAKRFDELFDRLWKEITEGKK